MLFELSLLDVDGSLDVELTLIVIVDSLEKLVLLTVELEMSVVDDLNVVDITLLVVESFVKLV